MDTPVNLDLNKILASMTENSQQHIRAVDGQSAQLRAANQQFGQLMTEVLNGGEQHAIERAGVAELQAEVEYKQRAAEEQAAVVAGLDPDDLQNQYVRSLAEYDDAQEQRKAALDRYNRAASVGFMGNPMGFIVAQLRLPQLAGEHNSLLRKSQASYQNVLQRNQMLAAQRSNLLANSADQMKKIALTQAQLDQQAAQLKLDETRANLSANLAARDMQIMQHSNQRFNVMDSLFGKQLAVGQYSMSLEDRQVARAEREERMREQKVADEVANEGLLRLSQSLGLSVPWTMERLKQLPVKTREEILQASMNNSFGATIADAITFVERGNFSRMAAEDPGLTGTIRNLTTGLDSYRTNRELQARALAGNWKADRLIEEADDMYRRDLADGASLPNTGRNLTSGFWDQGIFNPYRAQHNLLIADAKAGAEDSVSPDNALLKAIESVYETGASLDGRLTGQQEISALGSVAMRVAAGTLELDQAAQDLVDYATTSARKNLSFFKYDLFGLRQQTRYMATFTPGSFFGPSIEADMMNYTSTKNALTRMVSHIRASQAQRYGSQQGVFQPGRRETVPVTSEPMP